MTKSAIGLIAIYLLFQIASPALAEECDCLKHRAGAAGPGACSLSESQGWCQISYRSIESQQLFVGTLGEDRAQAIFQNVPQVYVGFTPIENAYESISWLLYRDEPDGKTRVGAFTDKQFVDSIFLLAAVPGIISAPEKSDGVLLRFAESVLAVFVNPDDPAASQLSDEEYQRIFAEFTGSNDLAFEPLPVSLPNDLVVFVARGCFEIRPSDGNYVRSMVQPPGAPAAETCVYGDSG